ncbi:DUF3349 domain-containing protein [Paenibacillus dendritiformis]|uniref:DUF3349 domain-containing protein n=1 Tax=Paenibacillus dendritiformis TaxID=130049 RepID=UPI00143CEFFE|nr:DUF3349 domain-containing protein [Paenibacillus dendritiformis]NKI21354.1 DUF3349 domain-containing protein [Paenibacillus dendritiformis]NRF98340.1 DUF3349 domain-containing protein [Paenibacillus dendritiformis]
MLKSTFPNGIGDEEYFPLISLLYEYMSDRNLAKVISSITGKDITITNNDIQKSVSVNLASGEVIENIRAKDLRQGFEEWTEEE